MGLVLLDTPEKAKSSIQDTAVKLGKLHRHLLLTWATGCGKTLAALKIIQWYINTIDKDTKWYIVCEETTHIENWKREIALHGMSEILPNIELFCYASLHKYVNTKANLVLDEVHHGSEARIVNLIHIQADKIVSLSATVENDIKLRLAHLGVFYEYNISVADAIMFGILPEPKVYILQMDLDNSIRNKKYIKKKGVQKSPTLYRATSDYDNFVALLTSLKYKQVNDYYIEVLCTEQEYYELLSNDIEYWKNSYMKTRIAFHQNLFLRKALDRKLFVADLKTDIVKDVVRIIKANGNRYICFTSSIEQVKKISNKKNYICSENSTAKNNEIVNKFNSNKINEIYAVDMLRESVSLDNIDAGVITQLDSKQLSFVQMQGRIFRSKEPILFVVVARNTQDMNYLSTAIDGMDEKYIKYITVDDLPKFKQLICPKTKTQEVTEEESQVD